ncbi:MAG: ATP-binding protein [Kofleriaceae bacterium]
MIPPSEDFLRRMYQRSPVGYYRSTFDGRFLFVNPALVRMLGYDDPEEVLRLRLVSDVYWDSAVRARLIDLYRDPGVLDGVVVRWRTKQGTPLVVRLYGYLLPEEGCIDATAIDVTELDAAQTQIEQQRQALERSSTTLRLLWKQLPGLVWTVDRELRITSADGAAIANFGLKVEEELGKTLYQFFGVDRPGYLPIRRHLEALDGQWVSYHQEAFDKQYAVMVAPHRNEGGAIIGAIGVAIDVTMRHRLEQRMVDAQRAESLGVLAGGLAHDFNNLLVAILGNAELGLREPNVAAHGRGVLENIRAAALDAAALTTQLLTYAGRGEVVAGDLAIGPVIDELLRLAAPQIPENIQLAVEVPPELTTISGDATQVRQVVMNLLTNARDALAPTGGTITVRAAMVETDGVTDEHAVLSPPSIGRFVAIEVADDGPGMDARTLQRIFDPFFSTKPNGHGLGLASVLGVVRSHGGGISVRSQPGEGTVVQVLWPARRGARRRSGVLPRAEVLRTVMVVDDEDVVRDVLTRLIEDLGYAAISAASGEEALTVLEGATEIDALLVDLTMPGMGGSALVSEVRRLRPRLPVIICSGADRERAGVPPAEGMLAKPFRLDALKGVLVNLIGPPCAEPPDVGVLGGA